MNPYIGHGYEHGYESNITTDTDDDLSTLPDMNTRIDRAKRERERIIREIKHKNAVIQGLRNKLYPRSADADGNVTPTPITTYERNNVNNQIENNKQIVIELQNRVEEVENNIMHIETMLSHTHMGGKPRQRKKPKKSKSKKGKKSRTSRTRKCKGTIYTINGKNYCIGEKIMSKKNGVKKNRKHTSKKSKKAKKSKKTRKR